LLLAASPQRDANNSKWKTANLARQTLALASKACFWLPLRSGMRITRRRARRTAHVKRWHWLRRLASGCLSAAGCESLEEESGERRVSNAGNGFKGLSQTANTCESMRKHAYTCENTHKHTKHMRNHTESRRHAHTTPSSRMLHSTTLLSGP
jgi:hypothetical protein